MKKRFLSFSICVILFSYILLCNISLKPVLAAVIHTHSDDCYNGTLHTHTGSVTSSSGCFTSPNYHVHTGSSINGGNCYSVENYHAHKGSSISGGDCFTIPKFHAHTGSSTSSGGCYTVAKYHAHTGSSNSSGGCYTIPKYHTHTGSSTSGGGCYTVAKYHAHTGSSTSGGGCYTAAKYHAHTGSSTSGGGCYTTAKYHAHTGSRTSGDGCYLTKVFHRHTGSSLSGGGCYGTPIYHGHTSACYSNGKLVCTKPLGVIVGYSLNCGKTSSYIDYYSLSCGKTTSTIEGYSRGCGKTTSTIEGYTLGCSKTTSTIIGYSLGCSKTTSTIESYTLGCGKTTSTIESYSLGCGRATSTIEGYSLGCGKTTSTVESYSLGCGKTTSTIESYSLGCGKIEGFYYMGNTQVDPICDKVVVSIFPTIPTQSTVWGGTFDKTAIATFRDGSTGMVLCTSSAVDPYAVGYVNVILTYSGLVGNAKTTGTRTCNVIMRVEPSSNTICDGGYMTEGYLAGQVLYFYTDYYLNVDDARKFANNIEQSAVEALGYWGIGLIPSPAQPWLGAIMGLVGTVDSIYKSSIAHQIRYFTDKNNKVHISVYTANGLGYICDVSAWDGTYGQIKPSGGDSSVSVTYSDLNFKIGTTWYSIPYSP